ncbi:MAG: 5'-deoxynucleotidase [Corallococcus sp.]|nr:5'-deoxynucleotidase [Corallococcus sp.]
MYNFFAYLNRMKHIKRWGLMYSALPENIMEHSQQAAVIAHALATIANVYYGGSYNADRIAVYALFHETSEVMTGDLPTPIKYFNPEIRDSYKDIERLANDKLLSHLPQELKGEYQSVIFGGSAEERKLVKCADKICAYVKCIDELKMGNGEFAKAKNTIKAEIDSYSLPEVKYFMENFVKAFELTLDEMEKI